MRRLKHHADARLDGVLAHLRVVHAGDADDAAGRFVEAADQVDDGRLAAARRTHERDGLAFSDGQAEVGQHRAIRFVGEADVIELDGPAQGAGVDGVGPVDDLRLGVEQGEDAFGEAMACCISAWRAISWIGKSMKVT